MTVSAMTVLLCACGGGSPEASPTTTTKATTPTKVTTTTTSTPTTTTQATSVTTTSHPVALPGVLANCTSPPPQSLAVEPTTIFIACADAGIGVLDLTWSSWTAEGAGGSGELWENDCTPDCAAGVVKDYPAAISLSGVEDSVDGPAFTTLVATYRGTTPNGRPVEQFTLELPLRS
jgi:hypothetical protein